MRCTWKSIAVIAAAFSLILATTGTAAAQDGVDQANVAEEASRTSDAEEAKHAADHAAAVAAQEEAAAATPAAGPVAYEPVVYADDSSGDNVGAGSSGSDEILPLKVKLNGYYRARYSWIEGIPGADSSTASFGEMRLRLEPQVEYGPNPELFIARLHITIDGLDNVVFGDNARINNVPILATAQSATDINGFDLNDTLQLKRVWMEFLVPFGQMRVGRMQSHFGTGLLTHNGNDLAEWGEFTGGETFDRILFITRPLTIYNALATGDARKTPLVYAFAYDRLSQDGITDPITSRGTPSYAPYFSSFPDRSNAPYDYVSGQKERASEIINAVAWFDEEFGNAENDELFLGVYSVYRFQPLTKTRLLILDAAWRVKYTFGSNRLTFKTEGDFVTIQGKSGALAFTGGPGGAACIAAPCNKGTAALYNVMGRIGLADEGVWEARFESGFSSGDAELTGNAKLTSRAFNQNIKVGILMYQVALRSVSYRKLTPLNAQALGANGSVWNSKYFYPSFRYFVLPGIFELHGAFLVGWAHKKDSNVFGRAFGASSKCGLKSSCFLGWEANLALRTKMGVNDVMHIDIEGGLMGVGDGLKSAGVTQDFLWTVQMRSAMVF